MAIKMTYFDVTALGEPIRFLLAYGKMDFVDERLTSEEFAPRKETFPYGKLPILEIEGKTVHQSVAICRYLAKKVGLAGKTDWDALECDIMVDTLGDLRAAMASFSYEKNEEAKEQKKELVMSTSVPYYLTKFEDHLNKNGGHFVKDQLTWADLWFTGMVEYFNYMAGKDIFADRPALMALRAKVLALPELQNYLKNRPAVRF